MANFQKSFSEAYLKSSADKRSSDIELLKDKIKQEQTKAENKYKATTLRNSNIALATQFGDPDMAKKIMSITEAAGDDPDAQKNIGEFISKSVGQTQKMKEQESLINKLLGRTNVQPQDNQPDTIKNQIGNEQEQTSNTIEELQKSLPEGVSVGIGDFRITGSKVDVSQKKLINEIEATKSTVERVAKLTESVPDLGGINFSSENLIGKVLGVLPRGLEGRAREYASSNFTVGSGGGITGLSKQDEENLRTYISNLPTIGGETYKALSGDTGRLSDFDIERGKNLSWRPDLGETTGIRDKKNNILKQSVLEREKAIKQGKFTIDPNTGSILTPQVVENALTKLSEFSEDSNKVETILMEDANGNRALVDKKTGKVVKEL